MATNPLPTTLLEAIRYFSEVDVATEFVAKLRWPHGPTCPRCGSGEHSYVSTRRIWKCKDCKKQYSVKLGTIFEDSPLGLDKWLPAVWLIANSKNGISSHELGRALGVTQKSAWFMLHRIRLAMQTGSFDKLDGEVEVDETFIGGKARNMHKNVRARKITGTGGANKTTVMGIRQRGGETRAKVIDDTTRRTLHGHISENVKPGSRSTPTRIRLTGACLASTPTPPSTTLSGMSMTGSIRTAWRTFGRWSSAASTAPT
jgi:transposase-like protein